MGDDEPGRKSRQPASIGERRPAGFDRYPFLALLTELLEAQGPSGCEDRVAEIVRRALHAEGLGTSSDVRGNLSVTLPGARSDRSVLVTAHMDEIGMLVKRVDERGRLALKPLGGSFPYKYGEGAVDVLGRHESVPGVLSFGCAHVSKESRAQHDAQHAEGGYGWDSWWVETKRSREELSRAGVHPGARIVPASSRRHPVVLGEDYISCYALDNRLAVVVAIDLARRLASRPPRYETRLAFTVAEETHAIGAAWLCGETRPTLTVAIDIAPVMPEFDLVNSEAPVVWCHDNYGSYDVRSISHLEDAAERSGVPLQYLVTSVGGTDASLASCAGHTALSAAVGLPTENTHGWEISHLGAVANAAILLEEFLADPFGHPD